MTEEQQMQAEAAAFRSLVAHLQQRSDVQNIDLMNLSGFCRDAQQYVYGMTIEEWKRDFQTSASEEQKQQFEDTKPLHAKISGHN
jgi:hypothetical protein